MTVLRCNSVHMCPCKVFIFPHNIWSQLYGFPISSRFNTTPFVFAYYDFQLLSTRNPLFWWPWCAVMHMPWARNLPVSVNVRRCLHFRTTNIWSQCYGFSTSSRRFQYNYFCVWILWLETVIDSHPLNSQQEIRYLLFKLIHFAFKMERNFWHNVTYPRNYQHNNQKG